MMQQANNMVQLPNAFNRIDTTPAFNLMHNAIGGIKDTSNAYFDDKAKIAAAVQKNAFDVAMEEQKQLNLLGLESQKHKHTLEQNKDKYGYDIGLEGAKQSGVMSLEGLKQLGAKDLAAFNNEAMLKLESAKSQYAMAEESHKDALLAKNPVEIAKTQAMLAQAQASYASAMNQLEVGKMQYQAKILEFDPNMVSQRKNAENESDTNWKNIQDRNKFQVEDTVKGLKGVDTMLDSKELQKKDYGFLAPGVKVAWDNLFSPGYKTGAEKTVGKILDKKTKTGIIDHIGLKFGIGKTEFNNAGKAFINDAVTDMPYMISTDKKAKQLAKQGPEYLFDYYLQSNGLSVIKDKDGKVYFGKTPKKK